MRVRDVRHVRELPLPPFILPTFSLFCKIRMNVTAHARTGEGAMADRELHEFHGLTAYLLP